MKSHWIDKVVEFAVLGALVCIALVAWGFISIMFGALFAKTLFGG